MDFNFQQTIPASIQKQVDQNYKNRQIEVNASKIQVGSTAEQVAMHLYNEVQRYQASLPDDQDVAMMLTQFNESVQVLVKGIGYSGYNLVCFHGEDNNGKPLELIQHVQQLNFLLTVVSKPEPETPKRQIGFVGQVD